MQSEERRIAAQRSYRVATRWKSLRRQDMRSMAFRLWQSRGEEQFSNDNDRGRDVGHGPAGLDLSADGVGDIAFVAMQDAAVWRSGRERRADGAVGA
jgi:hypothetical protein